MVCQVDFLVDLRRMVHRLNIQAEDHQDLEEALCHLAYHLLQSVSVRSTKVPLLLVLVEAVSLGKSVLLRSAGVQE